MSQITAPTSKIDIFLSLDPGLGRFTEEQGRQLILSHAIRGDLVAKHKYMHNRMVASCAGMPPPEREKFMDEFNAVFLQIINQDRALPQRLTSYSI